MIRPFATFLDQAATLDPEAAHRLLLQEIDRARPKVAFLDPAEARARLTEALDTLPRPPRQPADDPDRRRHAIALRTLRDRVQAEIDWWTGVVDSRAETPTLRLDGAVAKGAPPQAAIAALRGLPRSRDAESAPVVDTTPVVDPEAAAQPKRTPRRRPK